MALSNMSRLVGSAWIGSAATVGAVVLVNLFHTEPD
jgi:hypothetical protein